MGKSARAVFVILFLAAASACTTTRQDGSSNTGTTANHTIRYVTLEEIRASLPAAPIVAGFDIDDTVLFSSPGFYYGMTNHDGPACTNKYGADPLHSKVFWNDMNGTFDNFSLPKVSGNALIQMHLKRGDRIVFITARDSSRVSSMPKILMQSFQMPKPDIVFTCDKPKRRFILTKGVKIYYGDSDSDILAADSAKVRPVRVLRSPLSSNRTSYQKVGLLGEEVLKDSEN